MPNQLARSKRRQSLAEHEAVLAALSSIARREKTSVMALLRAAARRLVRERAAISPSETARLRDVVWTKAPRAPTRFQSAAEVARFKRAQREFDRVLLDLGLAHPFDVQARNSIVAASPIIRILELDHARAASSH